MCGWLVFQRTLFAVLLLALASCSEDDGGGPTEPPAPIPRIDGIWSGTFATSGSGDSVATFDLDQTGQNVSGVVSVGAINWSLRGDVDSRGFFRWQTEGSTCGSFDGSAELTTTTHLSGRAELDRFFCIEGRRVSGLLELDLQRR